MKLVTSDDLDKPLYSASKTVEAQYASRSNSAATKSRVRVVTPISYILVSHESLHGCNSVYTAAVSGLTASAPRPDVALIYRQ